MNLCITNIDTNPEFIGGIQRVSTMLGNIWQKNHNIHFITFTSSPLKRPNKAGILQHFFLNDKNLYCEENLKFFEKFVKDNNIQIILNQHAEDVEMVQLCKDVKEYTNVKLISELHFAITHKTDIISQSFFIGLKKGNILKRFFIDSALWIKYYLLTKYKIKKQEQAHFRNVYESSDLTVLLARGFIPQFCKKIGVSINDMSKLVAINNPIQIVPDSKCIEKKEKLIIWCGRLEYGQKRLDRMLKLWSKFYRANLDWKLVVLGSGDVCHFQSLATDLGLKNIEFKGFCNPYEYYNRASILCMTSATEGLPMVLIEAQAYGCVPIAYNSFASLGDIITDGENGFSVSAFNEESYLEKLQLLTSDEQLRNKMSINALESVNRFDIEKIAPQWLDVFNCLLFQS